MKLNVNWQMACQQVGKKNDFQISLSVIMIVCTFVRDACHHSQEIYDCKIRMIKKQN